MRVPTLDVTVDGQDLTAAQAAISLIEVDVGMGAAHDRARIALSWQSPVANVSPGTPISVSMGYEETTLVLSGSVDHVTHRPWGLVVDVHALPSKLSTTRIGRSYLDLSTGDIVRDLLNEAGVEEGEIGAGPTLAAYHVDERRSAWHHVQGLANATGSEVSTTPDGSLNVRPAPGGSAGGLGGLASAAAGAATALLGGGAAHRYGAEVHDFAFGPATQLAPQTTVVAHGAGSELGAQKWHILVREPGGTAPDGPTLVHSTLRDREAADQLSAAIAAAGDRSDLRGWIQMTGDPSLRAGDTIEITELPHSGDASIRIRRLHHQLSSVHGFTTSIDLEAAA